MLLELGRVEGREEGQEGQVPDFGLAQAFPSAAEEHGFSDEGVLLAVSEESGDDARLLPLGRDRRGEALLLARDVVMMARAGGRGAAAGDR